MGDPRHISPAFERNRKPILEVLRDLWGEGEPRSRRILELASGPGQHAAWFAEQLPAVVWQPTEAEPRLLTSIAAWRADSPAAPDGLREAIHLEIGRHGAPSDDFGGALAVNFFHMVGPEIVAEALALVADALEAGGRFVVYDCFRYEGEHVSPSNARFDAQLRASTAGGRVHDFEAVDGDAAKVGLIQPEIRWLPANNQCVIWTRAPHHEMT